MSELLLTAIGGYGVVETAASESDNVAGRDLTQGRQGSPGGDGHDGVSSGHRSAALQHEQLRRGGRNFHRTDRHAAGEYLAGHRADGFWPGDSQADVVAAGAEHVVGAVEDLDAVGEFTGLRPVGD